MSLIERVYPESQFGGFSDIDGTVAFYSRVNALLRPDMTIMDVGCGRGAALLDDPIQFRRQLRTLRGKCLKVIGIDTDETADKNPGIDEFRTIAGDRWPVDNEQVDLIISDFVMEHIKNPACYFAEVRRVLKLNGIFCARTSNSLSYVGMLARIIPNHKHLQVLRQVQKDRREEDIFPGFYLVNTVWKIRRALKSANLDGIAYGYEAEPSYLQFSASLFLIAKYLHMMMPPSLRTCLFVFARKPRVARDE